MYDNRRLSVLMTSRITIIVPCTASSRPARRHTRARQNVFQVRLRATALRRVRRSDMWMTAIHIVTRGISKISNKSKP